MFRKLINSAWFYFVLAGLLLIVAALSQVRTVGRDSPMGTVAEFQALSEREDLNLIFLLIDTLRADRLSAYGYERQTSPHLDSLAARGVRFASVEAQSSWTKASMASMWTGRYPEQTGITRSAHAVPSEALLPPEIFKRAGYRTAGVWRNGWVANNFGFDQGFDLYYRPAPDRSPNSIQRRSPSAHRLRGTDLDVTQSAVEFILNHREEQFFLYLHYMDIHQYVYSDTSPSWGVAYSDIYDSAIHWTDENIGVLIHTLYEQELLDKTVIVIGSDHGEAFFEHGWEGHGRNLYAEVQQVPLIIVPPFRLENGLVVEEPVANIDIWPTLLDMFGLPPLPGAAGRSLLPLIESAGQGESPASDLTDRPLFAQLDRAWGRRQQDSDLIVSMTEGPYRYLYKQNEPDDSELYDHSTDPSERNNLMRAQAEQAKEFETRVTAFLEDNEPSWGEAPEVEVDGMMKAQLRALGYVFSATDPEEAQRRKRVVEEARQGQGWEPN